MIDDFLLRALLAGLGVAVAAGPLGCFIVWRRMAYFGDAMAHSALLGIAVGLLIDVNLIAAVAAVGLGLAAFLTLLTRQRQIAPDTLLGIFAHASLSLGLITLSVLGAVQVDLHGFLFGDILAVDRTDVLTIWGGAATVLALLALLWRPLLAATVDREMARVEGLPVDLAEAGFMLIMALTIAAAIKVVGILLTTALLIVPAAAARRFAGTPERMAVLAVLLGVTAVAGGLGGSLTWDTPAGPSIVVCAAALFAVSLAATGLRRGRR